MKKRFKKIYIEITNICNLNCNFCPKTKRKQEFMNIELFKNIITHAKPLTEEITLHVLGEPLIHPNFSEIIKICEKEKIKINLTTNGTLIKNKKSILLNKTIRRINFSIHGLSSNFPREKQFDTIKKIIEYTKLAHDKREDQIITYRLWNLESNLSNENKEIINFIEKRFDVQIENSNNNKSMKVKNNTFIHFDKLFEWPNNQNKNKKQHGYCHGLSTHIGILTNGDVVPCCLDYNGNLKLGNIKENTIEDILDKTKTKNIYNGFKRRELIEEQCKKCTFIKRFERPKDNL